MKDKFINKLYDFWKTIDDNEELLLKEITENVNDGIDGINVLLDWCRGDFDGVKEIYRTSHNLNEEEMEEIMEEYLGDYTFMYEEIGYVEDLDYIWNLCNWYLDYLQDNGIDEKWLLDMIERG